MNKLTYFKPFVGYHNDDFIQNMITVKFNYKLNSHDEMNCKWYKVPLNVLNGTEPNVLAKHIWNIFKREFNIKHT